MKDGEFRREAMNFAQETMEIVRRTILTLIDRLERQDYRFAYPDSVYVPPVDDTRDLLEELERKGLFLPISLQAWLTEVGRVNLMGSHPKWPNPGYLFKGIPKPVKAWCTDPLVVEVRPDLIPSHLSEWQLRRQLVAFDNGADFQITVAPDEFHKANLSGGDSYQIQCSRPAVDAIVLNERHCLTFMAYLRYSLEWGGFPGFELIEDPPMEFLNQLRAGLERF
jgi:hypothetical protein